MDNMGFNGEENGCCCRGFGGWLLVGNGKSKRKSKWEMKWQACALLDNALQTTMLLGMTCHHRDLAHSLLTASKS